MGRMLEALGLGEVQRKKSAAPTSIPDPTLRLELPENMPAEEPILEDFPFIEVGGGPGKKIEASATVLATPMPTLKPERKLQPKNSGPLVPTLSQPKPMTVAFEPWPAQGKTGPATEIISYHQPEHPVSKQYDSLFEKVSEGSRVLLFAGPKGAGTSTVLLNLAFSGCMRFGKKLAVVESTLSRPVLAERLGISPVPGWAEFLAGNVGLEKIIRPTIHPLLHALTRNEKNVEIPCEVVSWVIGWLRDRFDLVLVDGLDLEDGQKMAGLSGVCDGLYLVLPQNNGGAETAAIQNVTRQGMRLRGLIHTQFENV
jgi:Mrp family chromosome partitioning ATPase